MKSNSVLLFSCTVFLAAMTVYADNSLKATPCDSECGEVLKIKEVRTDHLTARCVDSCKINNAKDIVTNSLCAKTIAAKMIVADQLGVNSNVCFSNIDVTSSLCVKGHMKIGEVCQGFRATAQFFADVTYTLGTPIPYDHVLDDPDGDVTLLPEFGYTVPASGYYIVSIQIDQKDLITPVNILGNPTGYLDVLVNGNKFHTSSYPYLTFSNEQRGVLSSLYMLNKGDFIQADYRIAYVDPVTGLQDVVGTVVLEGGSFNSTFSIHYLSSSVCPSSCSTLDIPCQSFMSAIDTTCSASCSRLDSISWN